MVRRRRTPEEEERLRLEREEFIESVRHEMEAKKMENELKREKMQGDIQAMNRSVLNHPVLQAHYRPDLFDERYMIERPSKVAVEQAIFEVFMSTTCDILRHALKQEGVYWKGKGLLQMRDEICMISFAKLKNTQGLTVVPYPAGLGSE